MKFPLNRAWAGHENWTQVEDVAEVEDEVEAAKKNIVIKKCLFNETDQWSHKQSKRISLIPVDDVADVELVLLVALVDDVAPLLLLPLFPPVELVLDVLTVLELDEQTREQLAVVFLQLQLDLVVGHFFRLKLMIFLF